MPVPSDSTNPNVRTSMGSANYAPENDALVWKIKSFPGGKVIVRVQFLTILSFNLSAYAVRALRNIFGFMFM